MKENANLIIEGMIKTNSYRIESLEESLKTKQKDLAQTAAGSIRDIVIFADSLIETIKRQHAELENLLEQNRMLNYLLESEEK